MNIPLDKMSVAEKLEAISLIWDSLSNTPDQIPVPVWQNTELDRRAKLIDAGEMAVSDLDEVEKRFDQLGK